MKNPPWHRDELILALDLYFNSRKGPYWTYKPTYYCIIGDF